MIASGSSQRPGPRRWAILAVLCVSLLIVSLDTTILNVALPTIVRDLHATSSELQLIVDAYAVIFGGLLLSLGSLGDRRGRKTVFLSGLVAFAAGSLAASFSGSPDQLIAARAFMGVGAAAIMPSTLSILTNVFVDAESRARAIGVWSGTTGLGVALGPIAGGWLLSHYWWGSVFLINVPIALLGALAGVVLVPQSKDQSAAAADVGGAILSIAGLGLLLWGIIEAPTRGWSDGFIIGSMCAGFLVLIGFVVWERKSSHPMLVMSFFRSKRFSAALAAMALVIFALNGVLFLITQWLQFDLGYTPFGAGIRVGPVALVLLVVAPISAFAAHKFGTKIVVASGMLTIVAGLILLSRIQVDNSYTTALVPLFLLGIGTGLAFAPSTESVMGSLPRAKAGVGSATNSTSLQVGGALGVGVLGSLLNTRYQGRLESTLAHYTVPSSIEHLILGSLGGALEVGAKVGGAIGAGLAALARSAFVSGMDLALFVGALAVAAGVVIVLVFLPSRPERQQALEGGSEQPMPPAAIKERIAEARN